MNRDARNVEQTSWRHEHTDERMAEETKAVKFEEEVRTQGK